MTPEQFNQVETAHPSEQARQFAGMAALPGAEPLPMHQITIDGNVFTTNLPEGIDLFEPKGNPPAIDKNRLRPTALDSLSTGEFRIVGTEPNDDFFSETDTMQVERIIEVRESDKGKVTCPSRELPGYLRNIYLVQREVCCSFARPNQNTA